MASGWCSCPKQTPSFVSARCNVKIRSAVRRPRTRRAPAQGAGSLGGSGAPLDGDPRSEIEAGDSSALPSTFCIIEDRSTVQDFATLQLDEIKNGIKIRRNRIFLLMEEVRRLRIQERLKSGITAQPIKDQISKDIEDDNLKSALPFLPPLTDATLDRYFFLYHAVVAAIILFGGLVAPVLEVRLGMGGTTYGDFISSMHLPRQLAQVDPIVASFCGGAVGVLSALLLVETNNIKTQLQSRCLYCSGTGYLECGSCQGSGCSECNFTGKVMCTSCLCTGKKLATEFDVRVDPFD